MPIFGTKEIESLQLQVQQLSEQLKTSNESLETTRKALRTFQATHSETKAQLAQRTEELRLTKTERDAAQQSLAEFEKSLRASLRQLGTMLEIGTGRWVDPAAVWHVFIQAPYTFLDKDGENVSITMHTLYLNAEAVLQGSAPLVLSKAKEILAAKSKV